jgi:Domain of unknown function (DUF4832)
MGFHDDSFAFQTLDPPEWMFMGRLKRAGAENQWHTQPIGGELSPDRQPCTFGIPSCTPPKQDFNRCVDATHATWILNHFAFAQGYVGADYERAVAGAERLGYDLFVSSVRVSYAITAKQLAVDLKIQNRGVAPFYYDWAVQLGVADSSNQVVATYGTDWKLTKVIARRVDVQFAHVQNELDLSAGEYQLLMRAVNPMISGHPLVFANRGWGRTVPNWVTLATFRIDA